MSLKKIGIRAAIALAAGTAALAALAQPTSGPQTGIVLRNTVTGETLDVSQGKEGGRDTEAVKTFLQTGKNLYIDDKSCLRNGESLFATSARAVTATSRRASSDRASTTTTGPIPPTPRTPASLRPSGAAPTA